MLSQPGRAVPSRRDSNPPCWWPIPSGTEAVLSRPGRAPAIPRTYRIGEGFLTLASEEASLGERFFDLFAECEEAATISPPVHHQQVHLGGFRGRTMRSTVRAGGEAGPLEPLPPANSPVVCCLVEAAGGSPVVRATFEDPEPLDVVDFCRVLFEGRGYREIEAGHAPWRLLASAESPARPLMAASGETCLFEASGEWQPLLGNLALNRLLRLQRETIFLHAGSVSIAGLGVLLPGGKGSGKTTLSLTLASRGHGFLGDEIGAVSTGDWSLLPVRRAVSIRMGPSSARVREAIESGVFHREDLPDGSVRTRARVGELFPGARASKAPFRAIFFLGGRRARAECIRLRPGPSEIGRLPLSPATLREISPPRRYLALMRLLGQAACFDLHPGDPDETAALVERTVEAL